MVGVQEGRLRAGEGLGWRGLGEWREGRRAGLVG